MAVFNKSDLVAAGAIKLPTGCYHYRCISSKIAISRKSGAKMFVNQWELYSPEKVEVGGVVAIIAGQKFTDRVVISPKAIPFAFQNFFNILLPDLDTINDEDDAQLDAICKRIDSLAVRGVLSWEESFVMDGEDKVLDSDTNQPISNGWQVNVRKHLGFSTIQPPAF